jgi:ubiquinone/menaquinone biosynthesis C-methylase UbiE
MSPHLILLRHLMQSAINPAAIAENPLKAAYQTLQWGKNIFALAHRETSGRLRRLLFPLKESDKPVPLNPKALEDLQRRFQALLEQDWQDGQAGFYPVELLFDNPWDEFFRYYPVVCLDSPKVWQRAQNKRCQEFADNIDTTEYPKYYVQNFHHQTDGYLSETSANLYDLQVELLFGGAADPMRRRILPLLKQALANPAESYKILDIASGTGATLRLLRAAFPKAKLFGMDLSPAYLRKADRLLSQRLGELPQLLQANAEELPYQDNYFQAVTNVFLLHELPAIARQRVLEECHRVLQPGGTLVICDSIQVSDAPELAPMMEGFAKAFHEPYYNQYIRDNLTDRLEQIGFRVTVCETHYLSKYFAAQKL